MKVQGSIIIWLCAWFIGAAIFTSLQTRLDNPIGEYYKTEVAVSVSPHSIKTALDNWEDTYIVVDLRTAAEYQAEHWRWSINIPGSLSEQEIVQKFTALPKDKKVVVFCYSAYCTLAHKVGNLLAEHGIYVSHLNIGWYELRYGWELWEWPAAKNIDISRYMTSGAEPWIVDNKKPTTACTSGALWGC